MSPKIAAVVMAAALLLTPAAQAAGGAAEQLQWAQLIPPAPPKLKPFFSKPGTSSPGMSAPGMSAPGMSAPGMSAPGMSAPGMSSTGVPGTPFDLGTVPNDGTPAPDPKTEGRWMSGAQKAPSEPVPVVDALDGKLVQIGGYIVPLDFDATTVKEFLLVPFVGACVHVPPPPANQIIFVKSAKGIDVGKVFDPIYVTGTMKVNFTSTGLADAGYSINADQVERR
jgi:uncharacterized protein